jgi:hypothetical protein
MRGWMLALVVAAAALGGACSAVDDFTRFSFTDGGVDGGGRDGGGLPGFGEACTVACNSSVLNPLTCVKSFGGKDAPGGICTRQCSSQLICHDLPNSMCLSVEGTSYCMPICMGGGTCRTGWDCCADRKVTSGTGACAPSTTDFCGH